MRRRALTFVVVLGSVVTGSLAVLVVRDFVTGSGVILNVDRAVTAAPPQTIPVDAAGMARESPKSLTIGDLDMWGPVRSVGVEDTGELEVPGASEIGWYKYGSAPGLPGATVLAAHVSWNREIGPFNQLGRLEPGALVEVRLDDDSIRTYEVIERTMYLKDELPRERIWRTTGDETLVLITCGGDYNPQIRRYRHNIVVYAVPVDAAAAADVDGETPSSLDTTAATAEG